MTEPEPIMILGTGRCGSTSLQMALNRVGDIWIWGEHDGMLRSLMAWSRLTRESEPLKRFSYPHVGEDPRKVALISGTHAAWLCSFNPEDVSRIERQAVLDLLARRLPDGKSRWGFKEIRYGADSHVPERMFELFPRTKLIHVVRNPADAIASALRAWHKDIFEPTLSDDELTARIRGYLVTQATRWVQMSSYLDALTQGRPGSAITVQIERLVEDFPRLMDFLGVSSNNPPSQGSTDMNSSPTTERVARTIVEQYADLLIQLPELSSVARGFGYQE